MIPPSELPIELPKPITINQIATTVLNSQLHWISTSAITPVIKELRVMVAFVTHSLVKENNAQKELELEKEKKEKEERERERELDNHPLLKSQSVSSLPTNQITTLPTATNRKQSMSLSVVKDKSSNIEDRPPGAIARRSSVRRSSIDLNREKLIESELGGSKDILCGGRPTETNLEFCVSLVLAIYSILSKLAAGTSAMAKASAAAASELSDEELFIIAAKSNGSYNRLMDIYDWYVDVVPKLKMQALLEGGGNTKSAASMAFSALGGSKKSSLPPNNAIDLDKLVENATLNNSFSTSLRNTQNFDHHQNCWLPHEVSDAIACIYECRIYDMLEQPEDELPEEFPGERASLCLL